MHVCIDVTFSATTQRTFQSKKQDAADKPDRGIVPFSLVSRSVLFHDGVRRRHVYPHISSTLDLVQLSCLLSLPASFAALFSSLFPFCLSSSPSFYTLPFYTQIFSYPSTTFFFYLLLSPSSSGCPYLSSLLLSPPTMSNFHTYFHTQPPIHPYSVLLTPLFLPSSVCILLALCPAIPCSVPVCLSACYESLFSADVQPSVQTDSHRNGCNRWLLWLALDTHTHTYKAQNRTTSPFLSLLPTLTFHHILTFA